MVAQLKAGDAYTWDVSFHDIFNSAYKDTVIYFNKWFIERLAIEVAQDMWWDWAHPNLPLGMNSKKDRDYPRFLIKMPRRKQQLDISNLPEKLKTKVKNMDAGQ